MQPSKLRALLVTRPIDQHFCMAVGNVVIQWSYLDQTYNGFIERLLISNGTMLDFDWKSDSPRKRHKLMMKEAEKSFGRFPRIISELENIKAMLGEAIIDRNLLAHGEIAMMTPSQQKPYLHLRVRGRYRGIDYERDYPLRLIQDIYSSLMTIHGRVEVLTSDELAADIDPGWSEQELSALRNFRARTDPSSSNPSTPDKQRG